MVVALCHSTEPIPPPAYTRALAKQPASLHLNALTVVTSLHLLALCRLAVQRAATLSSTLAERTGRRAPAV